MSIVVQERYLRVLMVRQSAPVRLFKDKIIFSECKQHIYFDNENLWRNDASISGKALSFHKKQNLKKFENSWL